MKKLIMTILGASMLAACSGSPQSETYTKEIATAIPAREPGQTDMVAFAADPIDTVRIGIIGLGMRGPGAVERLANIDGTEIRALCDIEPDRVAAANELLVAAGRPAAEEYSGNDSIWRKLVERDDLDLIYVVTDWTDHAKMGVEAMNQGKHVAIEVPAAMSLEEIWDLINTSERTRRHCMMLENCVYDFFEMNTLNMAQQGLFGEILHTEGSYIHNLDPFWEHYHDNWRMDYNREHRGDVYATHGMGPACQLLDIHRGDRMTTLVSMDTKAASGPASAERIYGEKVDYKNGDHTMTMIRTNNGKTIHIQHDVVNPRPYSRMYQLTGTKGFANKYPVEGYAFEPEALDPEKVPDHEALSGHDFISADQTAALLGEYTHPIVKEVGDVARKVGGHGGMDYIMDYRLIYCLRNGLPLDMDVYDLAEWCAVGPLSALSIENGSAPVAVPDFTRGAWNKVNGFRHAMKE